MLTQVFELFQIKPDVEFTVMLHNQSLPQLSALMLNHLSEYLKDSNPDFLICQGDTSTAFIAALAAFYLKIPVGHVEAGLRTNDKYSPFPEEMNRLLISKIADLHFAPTSSAQIALLNEGVSSKQVMITGNTVIDALLLVKDKIDQNLVPLDQEITELMNEKPYVLITGHRRENFGQGFQNICNAIKRLAGLHPQFNFIYPVHLNPNVKELVWRELGGIPNVKLIAPLDYVHFISALANSYLVLTDSGGVQEEAPSFGKPVLVMRENSERMEGVIAGVVKIVGTNEETIVSGVSELIKNTNAYNAMIHSENPYGDGKASAKICAILENYFS